jgi:hypothetical protein
MAENASSRLRLMSRVVRVRPGGFGGVAMGFLHGGSCGTRGEGGGTNPPVEHGS